LSTSSYLFSVAHGIQQSIGPALLVTGIGSILNVMSGRLTRIIDRIRTINGFSETQRLKHDGELDVLYKRKMWIHAAIILCTSCALFICIVVAAIFVGTEFDISPASTISILFIIAMVSLIAGLLCFLREISLTTGNYHR
jgi:hypothetical protein